MDIPITRPLFGPEEEAAVIAALRSGWVAQGPKVAEFEETFSRYVGSRFAVATTSCTTALHLALVALGIGPGDEVIVPAFTWVSSANVVEYVGATPVFADIDLESFNLDPASAEARVTPRTRAIMPVHLFGLSADTDRILDLARRHHLRLIEDAACGLGARYRGRHVGTLGDVGCFSFHPRKSITTGEGGMLITDDAQVADLARSLRDHGASRSDLARHLGRQGFLLAEYPHRGFNYRMTDLQAAVGCVQMGRVEGILAARARLARAYDGALRALPWLRPPAVPEGCTHGYQAYVCLYRPEPPALGNVEALHRGRNALMDRLEAQGIATRQGTHAAALTAYYAKRYGVQPSDVPRSALAEKLSLTLPLYAQMTGDEQGRVLAALGAA
jgi:dTDP-4-amino-4,6-dideoxygalactose transaminase